MEAAWGRETPSPRAWILGRQSQPEARAALATAELEFLPFEEIRIRALEPDRWPLARLAFQLYLVLGLGTMMLLCIYPFQCNVQLQPCSSSLALRCRTRTLWPARFGLAVFTALTSWALAWISLVRRGKNAASRRYVRAVRLWLMFGYVMALLKLAWLKFSVCEAKEVMIVATAHFVSCGIGNFGMTVLLRRRVHDLETVQGTGEWGQRMTRYIIWPTLVVLSLTIPACYVMNPLQVFFTVVAVLSLGQLAGTTMALRAFQVALDLAKAAALTWAGGLREARLGLLAKTQWQLRLLVLCAASTVVYQGLLAVGLMAHFNATLLILQDMGFSVDLITNSLSLFILSGLLEGVPRPLARWSSTQKRSRTTPGGRSTADPEWCSKVHQLSRRGITLERLLDFYGTLGRTRMAHWDPSRHRTAHVVRQAIVPATASSRFGPCALATLLMEGESTPAQCMVTHCWDSLFVDLVSAVVADALKLRSYRGLAAWLAPNRIEALRGHLRKAGTLRKAYWICAVSVNQHSCICAGGVVDLDPVLLCEEPRCDCHLTKCWNSTPPLNAKGDSCPCEVNKFDDMMTLLAQEDPYFSQVIVIDRSFAIFGRAWCMMELFVANSCAMEQVVLVYSEEALVEKCSGSELKNLKVEDMQASRAEDKQMILEKIADPTAFNDALHKLLLERSCGLLSACCDAIGTARTLGQLAKSAS